MKEYQNYPFHVIWRGKVTGIVGQMYQVIPLIENYVGARYNGFYSYDEALKAYRMGYLKWRKLERKKQRMAAIKNQLKLF